MGDASVSFELDAPPQRRTTRRPSPAPLETPTALCLTISTAHAALPSIPFSWRDEDGRKLEQQLTDIIIGMAVAGEHLHRKWLEQQAAWRRKQQEEAEREAQRRKVEAERRERERLAAIETAKRDMLRNDATAWREAADIRAYVEAVRRAAALPVSVDGWTRWALLEADRIDPIASGRALEGMREGQPDDTNGEGGR
jgi:hypothetical protein